LGTEAAGAALGELEARVPTRGSALLINHIGPRLELLGVDNFADVRVGELAMAERRDVLAAGASGVHWIAGLVIVLMAPFALWYSIGRPELMVQLMSVLGAGLLGREWFRHRRVLNVSRPRLIVGAASLVIAGFVAISGGVPPILLGSAVLMGLMSFALTDMIPITTKLPSGRSVRAPAEHWENIGIRWEVEHGELFLRPRDGIWLDADDSRAFLRHILEESLIPALTDEELTKGHLLATTHSITGILGALDAWRRDSDDTLRLTDIPVMYLIALDLGFERCEGGSLKAQLAHEKLLEAARVAEEAEALDRLPEGG
jgi:hypothetical protein